MILILDHMRHQAPGPLLSPRRSHPKLNIMTKWLNAPPLWNVFITITTPSPVPSPSQVWIFKQHLIPSSPPPHLTLSTLSSQPRSVKGVPLSKFDSSHSSTIYWPGLILLNIVTISTWWILSPCTFDVRFRAVNKSLQSFQRKPLLGPSPCWKATVAFTVENLLRHYAQNAFKHVIFGLLSAKFVNYGWFG